jgi:monofunctional biosynthetic peptidoglycan transglycosylase
MSKHSDSDKPASAPGRLAMWSKKIYRWGAFGSLYIFTATVLLVVVFRFIPIPFTPLMLIRCGEQMTDAKRDLMLKKDWVPLHKISPHMQLAVVCAEDQLFVEHEGFDYEAIDKALKHNKRSKRKRGASTISQQTAKNLFLYPNRSWVRKGFEVYFTLLIESFWSKNRIMEAYLNIIELGDGIYGAEAASRHFFKKPAAKLTPSEAALLAAVLPNPLRYSAARPSAYVQRRQSWILSQMQQWDMKLEW